MLNGVKTVVASSILIGFSSIDCSRVGSSIDENVIEI
jgi:hypothetical protein